MSYTIHHTQELEVYTCWCGIAFALPKNLLRQYKERKKDSIYCPHGHSMVPSGKSEADKLRAQLASVRERCDHYQETAEYNDRRRAAAQGQVTKIKNRVGHGVCPCCKRTFKQLASHMESKHPDYLQQAKP